MHCPVMVGEVLDLLAVRPAGIYLDGTLGMGGHARAMLERMEGKGWLLGMDWDAEALRQAQAGLAAWHDQLRLACANYVQMAEQLARWGVAEVDGILLDLGMSSGQVDRAERGFSFQQAGPLDMRMDRRRPLTAAALLRSLPERELAEQLRQFGEEPAARRIARAIVSARQVAPLTTTDQLAELVVRIRGGRRGRTHPATRTFQALRIMVNQEIENLEQGLEIGLSLLRPGGRLAVIAYHSLEDRAVKRLVREHIGRWEALPAGGQRRLGRAPEVRWVTPKPVTPTRAEISANPRARSAKLRVAERIK